MLCNILKLQDFLLRFHVRNLFPKYPLSGSVQECVLERGWRDTIELVALSLLRANPGNNLETRQPMLRRRVQGSSFIGRPCPCRRRWANERQPSTPLADCYATTNRNHQSSDTAVTGTWRAWICRSPDKTSTFRLPPTAPVLLSVLFAIKQVRSLYLGHLGARSFAKPRRCEPAGMLPKG